MEIEMDMDTKFGEQSLDDIAAQILDGLGVPCTDANHLYLFMKLSDVVEYVTELSAEIAAKTVMGKGLLSDGEAKAKETWDDGTIEL